MPFNNNGTFDRVHNWTEDKSNNIDIKAVRLDEEDNNFANGLSKTLLRDGSVALSGNLKLGNNKIVNVKNGTSDNDAINKSQLDTKQNIITGAASSVVTSNLTPNKVIVSDNSGKIAASNKSLDEVIDQSNIVHKTDEETITGKKIFKNQIWLENDSLSDRRIYSKNNAVIRGTNPPPAENEKNAGTDFMFVDSENTTLGHFDIWYTYEGNIRTAMKAYAPIPKEDTDPAHPKYAQACITTFPAGHAQLTFSTSDGIDNTSLWGATNGIESTVIPTKGWVNNPDMSTNVVHRSGPETIAGIKTFSTSPLAPTPATTDSSTKVATTAFVKSINNDAIHKTGNETLTGIKTFSTSPVVPTKTVSDVSGNAASTKYVHDILAALYPIGAIYIGTQNSCPLASLISGSTWSLVAKDKALWGKGDNTSANTNITAGLPNITGTFIANKDWYGASATGAFTSTEESSQIPGGLNYGSMAKYNLNASRSSSIYGNSSTVQPPAYVVNVWRRTK